MKLHVLPLSLLGAFNGCLRNEKQQKRVTVKSVYVSRLHVC